jgi:hypothetical protein
MDLVPLLLEKEGQGIGEETILQGAKGKHTQDQQALPLI